MSGPVQEVFPISGLCDHTAARIINLPAIARVSLRESVLHIPDSGIASFFYNLKNLCVLSRRLLSDIPTQVMS